MDKEQKKTNLNTFEEKTFYKYWGKAEPVSEGIPHYHLLSYHCLDVAAVGYYIMSSRYKYCDIFATKTKISKKLVQFTFILLLMIHDLGKFSKAFQSLVPVLFDKLFPGHKARLYSERHDTIGFIIWREAIKAQIAQQNKPLAEVLDVIGRSSFGHHGIPPKESTQGGSVPLRVSNFLDSEDLAAAISFVQECLSLLGEVPDVPTDYKSYKQVLKEISWHLTGLAILADWIGSNIEYFPFNSKSVPLSQYWCKTALTNAEKALSLIGWKPCKPGNFTQIDKIFPFILAPTPLQQLAENITVTSGAKLFIIEDVTGSGKTEAAIIIAAKIMAVGEAEGIYIALPTMATANAMYDRMQEAYRKLFYEDDMPSLILTHGARHLSEKFNETVFAHKQKVDNFYSPEETASVTCNEWYADNRKKSLLADIGVGTVDQVLLGVLPARHQALRLLGMQRKILIIDEVHAYDPYMKHLLSVLLEAHARGGGSVILLSATIPQKKYYELIFAFRKGLGIEESLINSTERNPFPLFTQAGVNKPLKLPIETRKEVKRRVNVRFIHSFDDIIEFIKHSTETGDCICWIRNTVADAKKAFCALLNSGITKEQIMLFHSRFAMIDRARIETGVVQNFGKKSGPNERRGKILIATQVIEQSLDLDFDQMITDLAPIDLIIQRAGRLHRHTRDKLGNYIVTANATDERGIPLLYVFAPEFDENATKNWLENTFSGTAAVYRNIGNLWLTQKILIEKKGWSMPEDARELIEEVYGETTTYCVPTGLIEKVIEAEGEESSKKSIGHLNALILEKGYCWNAAQINQWNEDEKVFTRLSDENYEVVLAVEENGQLVPYAEVERFAWDWSCLPVSRKDWEREGYAFPEEFNTQVEYLRKNLPRLKFSQFIIVDKRSVSALLADTPISQIYDPHFGWGKNIYKEE